ncbi:MAG: AGE family epimerase/isomerase [Lachnospiraceae bacterium]|nr:AGE family epimerase/isomerase [Lachnospiraceae bacterium]
MDKISLAGDFADHLINDLIPFWSGLIDREKGGFYGKVDCNGRVDKEAVKGCILNSRILWFFTNCSMLFNELAEEDIIPGADLSGSADKKAAAGDLVRLSEDCMDYARHAYGFLIEHCIDKEYGGVYWSVNCDGTPNETLKHTYNQAFAIYALASFFDATGERAAYDMAMQLADMLEERCTDDVGYQEAFNCDFTPTDNDELSENGVMADKTMNTLLHVYEAFTELLRVTKKHFPAVMKTGYSPENAKTAAKLANRLKFILEIFSEKIYNPKLNRLEVFFDKDYNPIIDLHSYGHDIEASWLIDRGLKVLADVSATAEIEPITLSLAEKIYTRAYRDHSLMNECENGSDDKTRVWWVQAEAVTGFMHASQKYERKAKRVLENMKAAGASAAERHNTQVEAEKMSSRMYAAMVDIWECIKEKFLISPRPSEWYENLDENLNPFPGQDIVRSWKCPYHNGRMCIEMIKRLLDKEN